MAGKWVSATTLAPLQERFGLNSESLAQPLGQTTLTVPARLLTGIVEQLKKEEALAMDMLSDITAVDGLELGWPRRFALVYHFYSLTHHHRLRVKVFLAEEESRVPTLTSHYRCADWLEREVYDMFGIEFNGHPDLRRILLYPEFKGHPLRKDYPVGLEQPLVPLREIEA